MPDLSPAEVDQLVRGATISALVPRGTLTEGDEVSLGTAGHTAVVAAVDPGALGGAGGTSERDLVILRVYGPEGPVIDDGRFAGLRAGIEGAGTS